MSTNIPEIEAPAALPESGWIRLWHAVLARRGYLLVAVHLIIFAVSYAAAFELRFDLAVPAADRKVFWLTIGWVVLGKLIVFHRFGSLHGWWRYVTFSDLTALLRVSTLSTLIIAAIDHFVVVQYQIPRAVLALDWGGTILVLGGLRSVCRLFREEVWRLLVDQNRQPTLMIGAANGGLEVARQIHGNSKLNLEIVGFLDDDASHRGSRLGGIPFLGGVDQTAEMALAHDAKDLLIIAESISGERLRSVMDQCRQAHIHVRIIPAVEHWLSGGCRLELREVNIDDLLRRDPVQLNTGAIREMVRGKCVLVTGAGGSIGSEICRQLLAREPARLLLVERSENALFNIERELQTVTHGAELVACLADSSDEPRMEALFEKYQPQLLFHAAAHKHVPLMESNPGEAIKNNVFGTAALVEMAKRHQIERFVLVSTDKAVNPTSVMGASKHLAERYVHASNNASTTKFVVVRFGNVLASSGSVVPIFQEQIRRGGPVTITHPEMTRYFMTIPEASQLVLQAAVMGEGGEIFVLEMGHPVKILDLAKDLIRLSGFSEEEIPIEITGIRPGEKLYEELYFADEELMPTPHPKLRVANHRPFVLEKVCASLETLRDSVHGSPRELRRKLGELIPEYRIPGQPQATSEGKSHETQPAEPEAQAESPQETADLAPGVESQPSDQEATADVKS